MRGHHVTIVVRRSETLGLRNERLQTVQADALEPQSFWHLDD